MSGRLGKKGDGEKTEGEKKLIFEFFKSKKNVKKIFIKN